MPAVPAFTPCPGGFITAQTLPDGRYLVEGFVLTLNPIDDPDTPRTDPAYHWIAANEDEARKLVAEFTADLTRLASRKDA
ncbi:hypothetical protein GCM10010293_40600 [Streptomyces griseoflavus]|uniref:hypothetical protein n=1 Tax=Streptomyces griseoflavus TaxID=35619 RepID=UPI00167D8B00|nr:hypothetical protein [Streptomyces griseoflavus]GGV36977.1 hypothetical protein GCM10010293_40600 [Streptomyces griseoflavus]